MDEIDAKLARIATRLAARADDVRSELERIGALEIAQALRETFGARLVYLRTDRVTQGTDEQGHPYNFDLRPRHAATRHADDDHGPAADVPPHRSTNQPYRGRKAQGQRRTKPAGTRGVGGRDPMAWLDGR